MPGRLGEDSRFVPLLPRSDGSADAAVSLDGVTVAYIDEAREELSLGQLGGQVTPMRPGYTNLRAPQFVLGALWLLGDDEDGETRLLTLDRAGAVVAVRVTLPGALTSRPSRSRRRGREWRWWSTRTGSGI